MRRRRLIRNVVIFGVLGALVNLAVAWGFVYWTAVPFQSNPGPLPMRIAPWPVPAPRDWPGNAMMIDRWVSSGLEYKQMSSSARTIQTETTHARDTAYGMEVTLAGWPLSAFAAARLDTWERTSASTSMQRRSSRAWGMEIPPDQSAGLSGKAPRLLPLYPTMPGFVVNTILYALAIWLSWALPMAVIRWRRRRQPGMCVSCGYDLHGAAHERCPECGAAIGTTPAGSPQ